MKSIMHYSFSFCGNGIMQFSGIQITTHFFITTACDTFCAEYFQLGSLFRLFIQAFILPCYGWAMKPASLLLSICFPLLTLHAVAPHFHPPWDPLTTFVVSKESSLPAPPPPATELRFCRGLIPPCVELWGQGRRFFFQLPSRQNSVKCSSPCQVAFSHFST